MKTVLITGGSSGIGLEFSKLFAKDNYQIIIVSKYETEMDEAAAILKKLYPNVKLVLFQQDLSKYNAAQFVYDFVKKNAYKIDVLVNNAGVGCFGFVNDIDAQKEQDMIQLNVACVHQMTRLFLKDMVAKDKGKILNVSSIVAFQPSPFFATYAATKSFVKNFSQALSYELKSKKSKVTVTTVCPTPVKTRFAERADMKGKKLFESWMSVSADKVAKDGYAAMKAGKDVVIPKRFFQYINEVSKRMPTSLLLWYSNRTIAK
ncbi:MAG: short-subunit dehydrogenase [Maribacter sp.]